MLLDTHGNRVWPRRRYRERDPTKVMGYLACEPLRLPKQDSFMGIRHLASALTIYVLVGSVQARRNRLSLTNHWLPKLLWTLPVRRWQTVRNVVIKWR